MLRRFARCVSAPLQLRFNFCVNDQVNKFYAKLKTRSQPPVALRPIPPSDIRPGIAPRERDQYFDSDDSEMDGLLARMDTPPPRLPCRPLFISRIPDARKQVDRYFGSDDSELDAFLALIGPDVSLQADDGLEPAGLASVSGPSLLRATDFDDDMSDASCSPSSNRAPQSRRHSQHEDSGIFVSLADGQTSSSRIPLPSRSFALPETSETSARPAPRPTTYSDNAFDEYIASLSEAQRTRLLDVDPSMRIVR